MTTESAYLQRVRDLLADPHPDSETARSGFGREVWVESLRPVADGPYEELEVAFGLAVPDRPEFREVASRGVTRVPFGREWRMLSGYMDPSKYADHIALQVSGAVRRMADAPRRASIDIARVRAELPTRDELWPELIRELETHGIVRQLDVGVLELVEEDAGSGGVALTIVVTPDQWYDVVVSAEVFCRLDHGSDCPMPGDGAGWARFGLGETLESRHEDDRFVVVFDGDFSASIRAELPPVRGVNAAHGRTRRRL